MFFFSSRRRHTRWTGDWSSDVCSSDLPAEQLPDESNALRGLFDVLDDGRGLAHAAGGVLGEQVRELRGDDGALRSEERRVGKECRSRRWAEDGKNDDGIATGNVRGALH